MVRKAKASKTVEKKKEDSSSIHKRGREERTEKGLGEAPSTKKPKRGSTSSKPSQSRIAPWKHFQAEGFKNVYKDSLEWERDGDAEAFVEELLDEDIVSEIPVGKDEPPITHIKLTQSLFPIEGPSALFIRSCQEELWTEALSSSIPNGNRHLLVIGNPGIGKSISLIYLLRTLLQKQRLVVFEQRKEDIVYVFVPPPLQGGKSVGERYQAWKVHARNWHPASCAALRNPQNFYLIDPDEPSRIVQVPAHTILASSPNRSNYKEFEKYATVWVMPVWTENELLAIRPFFPVDEKLLSVNDVHERFRMFGGIIRYVFSSSLKFSRFWGSVREGVNLLSKDNVKSALTGDAVIEFQQENPQNRISSYICQYVVHRNNPPNTYAYAYSVSNVSTQIASEEVWNLIVAKYWTSMWNKLNPNSLYYATKRLALGRFFERAAILCLQLGGNFSIKSFSVRPGRSTIIADNSITLPTADTTYSVVAGGWDEYLTACSKLPMLSDRKSKRQIVVPSASNQPVVDLMDHKDRAFQITIADTHDVKTEYMGRLIKAVRATTEHPLQMFIVVPDYHFKTFRISHDTIKTFSAVRFHLLCIKKEFGNNELLKSLLNRE